MRLYADVHRIGIGLLATVLVLAAGCARESARRQYIARVGTSELTEDEVRTIRDSLFGTQYRLQEYVNDWIVTELLYQEAGRRGLADGEDIRRQLDVARKRLAITSLLEKEVYAADSIRITDDAVAAYFASNANELALREDVVNASYVLFADRDAANTFRERILRGTGWTDAVQQMQADSVTAPLLLRIALRQYFTQSTLYPDALWKLARTLPANTVSFAVKAPPGYYVLMAHSMKHQGETPDLDYVRAGVHDRLLIEQRRARYERLVAELRSRYPVEVHLANVDTASGPQ